MSVLEACYKKRFLFEDAVEKLNVTVIEVLDPSYGMYVWPCAPVLAQYIWKHRHTIRNKTVLEIGAGTALPGIVAGLLGAKVILSDSTEQPRCHDNCMASCRENGLTDVSYISLTWGRFNEAITNLEPIDVILGSDCFYEEKDFEDILVTIAFLLEGNPSAEFWCTYQERSSDRSIEHQLLRWRLTCQRIELSTFDADSPSIANSDYPGNHTIHMYIIRAVPNGEHCSTGS